MSLGSTPGNIDTAHWGDDQLVIAAEMKGLPGKLAEVRSRHPGLSPPHKRDRRHRNYSYNFGFQQDQKRHLTNDQ